MRGYFRAYKHTMKRRRPFLRNRALSTSINSQNDREGRISHAQEPENTCVRALSDDAGSFDTHGKHNQNFKIEMPE
jgi:hypothetical protein